MRARRNRSDGVLLPPLSALSAAPISSATTKTNRRTISLPRVSACVGLEVTTNLVCAKCGAPMVTRVAKKTGREFAGCSAFPRCFGKKGIAPTAFMVAIAKELHETRIPDGDGNQPAKDELRSLDGAPQSQSLAGAAGSNPAESHSTGVDAPFETIEKRDDEYVELSPLRSTLEFRGVHADFLADITPEIDLEGSLSCGKTTVALWKELCAMEKHPGIWILCARWIEDQVKTLLRPAFEQLARIHGSTHHWIDKFNYYEMGNGSRAYFFGLKTMSADPEQRYGKIRGLAVSRVYIDQAEQLPADIAGELRLRLRPDIEARLRGTDYPRQLTFTPNPTNFDHWLAKQFPEKNNIKGRKYYALSLFDNAHNLPADMIDGALTQYPMEHPKHQTVILGKRGLNVIGDAIYDNLFDRKIHVRAMDWSYDAPLIEAFELGKHNPVWVVAQRTTQGALKLLGGILGERLMLEDFIPVVRQHRAEWFPEMAGRKLTFHCCTSPMGEHEHQQSDRFTLINLLREAKFRPMWRDSANSHDVQLGMIEHVGALLRRRISAREEAIGINADPTRWLSAAPDGTIKERPFMAFAFEGGYVWDAHDVSVSNKALRQPFVDDEYSTTMRCVENLVLNFCAGQASEDDKAATRRAASEKARTADGPSLRGVAPWMI